MRSVALFCATLTATAGPLAAQRVSVLAGGTYARYADSVSGTAGLLSARFSASSPILAGAIEAGLSQFATGEWATQLGTYGTAIFPLNSTLAAGLTAGGQANNFEGGTWSGSGGAGPIVAVTSRPFLGTVGASIGAVRAVDQSSLTLGMANARLRYTLGGLWLEGGVTGIAADTLQYADAIIALTVREPRFLASVSGGVRAGALRDDPWGQARIEYGISPWTTLEAAAGRYPRDLIGFTNGLFATMGMRLNLSPAARERLAPRRSPLIVSRWREGSVTVVLAYPMVVERLEIAGEWNGWTPVPLRREGANRWSIELQVEPGMYKYALLVDGETWTVPAGVPTVPDDFGGKVGLLIVR